MTIPEQAAQAAQRMLSVTIYEWERRREFLNVSPTLLQEFMRIKADDLTASILTAAAPHLAAVRVNVDEIVQPLEDIHAPGGLCRWTDVATAIGEVRRALSALEPSAGRAAVLEEAARLCDARAEQCAEEHQAATLASVKAALAGARSEAMHLAHSIRALHPVADKPDEAGAHGGADVLAQFWRPISEADKSITFEQTFDIGDGKKMTIRNSDHYWVRDADGRVYEATWSDHKGGYWWDLEGESPVDPVEYMPHPLSLPTPPSGEMA